MSTDYKKIIKARDWQFYLSRPFTIFGASIWQGWYNSEDTLLCLGAVCPDVIFLEEEKSIARCYRPKDQLQELNSKVKDIIYDEKAAVKLFKEGVDLNKRAGKILSGKEK